jgi:iron complex transport system permease protein
MRPLTITRLLLRCGVLALILFAVVLVALKLGAVQVSLYGLGHDLINVLLRRTSSLSSDYGMIVVDIRLPRIFLATVVGASLAVAGTSFQALLRNPLADPFVLGVSSGAALGAILSLVIVSHVNVTPNVAVLFIPVGAFIGAALTIAIVYVLGLRNGQIDTPTLLLGGVIITSFLFAIIQFLLTSMSGSNLRGASFWLTGDLSTPQPSSLLYLLSVGFIVAFGAIYTTSSDLNLLLAGEKEAMHLGVDVPRVRIVVYLAASILTGLAVSVSGVIGYVGLLVPHVMRMIFGSDHRMLLPAAALGGAIALVIADTLARTITAPTDLPVGAITAMVGAPLFIYLLRRRLA